MSLGLFFCLNRGKFPIFIYLNSKLKVQKYTHKQHSNTFWNFYNCHYAIIEDIHFPDINFDPDCKFARKLHNARQAAKYEIQSICKSMKPLISLLKQKERHYENAIKALLKEEIPRSLHESGHSQSSRSNQVPVSAGWRFSDNIREGEMPVPVCKKVQEDWIGYTDIGYCSLGLLLNSSVYVTLELQEDELVLLLIMILKSFISISLLQPGTTRCHSTRIARGVPLPVYMNLDLYSGFWCTSHCVVF